MPFPLWHLVQNSFPFLAPNFFCTGNHFADLPPLPFTLPNAFFCPVFFPLQYLLSSLVHPFLSSLFSPLTPLPLPSHFREVTWSKLPKSESLVETKVLISPAHLFTVQLCLLTFAALTMSSNTHCKQFDSLPLNLSKGQTHDPYQKSSWEEAKMTWLQSK